MHAGLRLILSQYAPLRVRRLCGERYVPMRLLQFSHGLETPGIRVRPDRTRGKIQPMGLRSCSSNAAHSACFEVSTQHQSAVTTKVGTARFRMHTTILMLVDRRVHIGEREDLRNVWLCPLVAWVFTGLTQRCFRGAVQTVAEDSVRSA